MSPVGGMTPDSFYAAAILIYVHITLHICHKLLLKQGSILSVVLSGKEPVVMQFLKTQAIFLSLEKVTATCKRPYSITLGILRSQVIFYATKGKTDCVIQSS